MDREFFMKAAPALALVLLGMFLIWLKPNTGVFTLTNETWNTITEGEVRVCDQRFKFSNVATGKMITAYFTVTCDGNFALKAKFNNGQQVEETVGSFPKRRDTWGNAIRITTKGVTYKKG